MKKIILIVIVVLIIVWVGMSFFAQCNPPDTAPTVEQAPYMIQTFSRGYYAKQVTGISPNITLTGYYQMERGKWVFKDSSISFNRNFGASVVIDRR